MIGLPPHQPIFFIGERGETVMVENKNVITPEPTKKSSFFERAATIYVAADIFLKMDLTQSILTLIKSLIN